MDPGKLTDLMIGDGEPVTPGAALMFVLGALNIIIAVTLPFGFWRQARYLLLSWPMVHFLLQCFRPCSTRRRIASDNLGLSF